MKPWNVFQFQSIAYILYFFRVTTSDGSKYLIHKGSNYGESDQTVVVDAKYMSKNWESVRSSDVQKNVNIGELVKAGGKDYKLFSDNCYNAATRMEETTRG